tara:strand:- start:14089 stop:15039 length:951 start_codon:yes stop_codon:yes gene_type:complete
MSNNVNKSIWLIGSGNMGHEYTKVLQDLNCDIKVIGRSNKSCDRFHNITGIEPHSGGLSSFLSRDIPKYAIVATNEGNLFNITKDLIERGVENILVEKPAAINIEHINELKTLSKKNKCNLFVGYNRRFYQSVKACKDMIDNCNDDISVNFMFTEWVHTIPFKKYTKEELAKFFLCNSSHVADTVFHLFGKPKELTCYSYGKLDWHPSAAIFQGAGFTKKGGINYNANWTSGGSWGIEINMPSKKLILNPLERLKIQNKGSTGLVTLPLENEEIDTNYKPGLYAQVNAFFGNKKDLCTIDEQFEHFKWYYKMANYQ